MTAIQLLEKMGASANADKNAISDSDKQRISALTNDSPHFHAPITHGHGEGEDEDQDEDEDEDDSGR
jgi:hypothetical protein